MSPFLFSTGTRTVTPSCAVHVPVAVRALHTALPHMPNVVCEPRFQRTGLKSTAGLTRGTPCARADKGTGKKQDIKITGASTLAGDEVDRMVKDAEKFADEDKKKREAVDTRNQADSLVYQTEKQLKDLGDKVWGTS